MPSRFSPRLSHEPALRLGLAFCLSTVATAACSEGTTPVPEPGVETTDGDGDDGSTQPDPSVDGDGMADGASSDPGDDAMAGGVETLPETLPLDPSRVPADAVFTTFDADSELIRYVGRVSFADPKAPEFSAPGVYVSARFTGDAVAVLIDDEFKWGNNRSFFDVSIDGVRQPKLAPDPGVTRYLVGAGLGEGPHDIVIAKRTEASIGRTTFRGFEVTGELVAQPPPAPLHIEFIGDSITAGAGVEAANGSPECAEDAIPGAGGGWGQPYNNANRTYAAVAARSLGADYHLTAVSGIGLVRNYSATFDGRPMPEVYDLVFPEMIAGNTWDMTTWDTTRFTPDVVVVALGTNDFSPGDNPPDDPRPNMDVDAYVDAYEAFVAELRADYPDATILAISSPMLGNGWPNASDTFADDLKAAVAMLADRFAAAGDDRVLSFETSQVQPGLGCGTHPNAAQHEDLGEELAGELRRLGF